MHEGIIVRVRARVRALLPTDWLGAAGKMFRKTGRMIAEYNRDAIRPKAKLHELPDLAWNRAKGEANEKHSKALVNFQEEEEKKITNEIARRTADHKVREAKASADKMEADARTMQTNEMMARLALVERCQQLRVLPIWDKTGHMTFLKAPENYDWEGLDHVLLNASELNRIDGQLPAADAQTGGQPGD